MTTLMQPLHPGFDPIRAGTEKLESLHPGFNPVQAAAEEWEPKGYYNRTSIRDSEAVAGMCFVACALITFGAIVLDLVK